MVAHAFWAIICSSRRPSQIGPKAENDVAIPTPIFLLKEPIEGLYKKDFVQSPEWTELRALASKLHWCYIYFIVGRSFG